METDRVLDVNAGMRAAIDAYDWASTSIGPREQWPKTLNTVLSMVLDTPFAMLIMWGDDLVQIYNQAYVPIFGDKHPASLGQRAQDSWHDIWDEVGPLLRGVYERGEAVYFENLLLKMQRHGRYEDAYFTFSYSPIREENQVLGLICVVNETTAYVLREREMAERAETLAQLDRAKTQFFSNISHEFRTPLTLMLGPLEDLVRTLTDYEQRERADLARRNAIRLQKLVNMLLDFSSAQSGLVRAHREYMNLAELTVDLVSEFRSAFERAGLTLDVESAGSLIVPVDRTMYEKVVLNLLSNALKFTFTGGVAVSMERDEENFVLHVRDTGVGIAEEDLHRLFQRFSRVHGARSRTHEGSGIGLALVHELVGIHGGSIDVESRVGRGTCFTVRLPLHASVAETSHGALVDTTSLRREFVEEARGFTDAPPEPEPALSPGEGARVLIADDNADLRRYLRRLLGTRYRVALARDGKELIELARAQKPDLVISDIMMPGLDGLGALEALRSDPATADLPIILLSARAGDGAAVEGLARGADDYIVKPFVAADLVARVDTLLRRTGSKLAPSVIRAQREAAILSAAADRFISATDTGMVWDAVTCTLAPAFTDWCYVFTAREDGQLDAVSSHHDEPAKRELAELFVKEFPHRLNDGTIPAKALAESRTVFVPALSREYVLNRDARYAAILSALEIHSEVAVPVLIAGRAAAVIVVVRSENTLPFDEQDCRFLETFAARVSLAYENTKAQERERTIASVLQRALLPRALPSIPGVRFSASYSPAAQEALVGGDWYDAFPIDGRRVIVSIGDVVGHGLEAATIMASLRQGVRSFALENRDPSAILASLNRLAISEHAGHLATAYVADVDTQTLEIRVASAGHHSALLLQKSGAIARFSANGLMLGVQEDVRYETVAYTMAPDDMLAFFTDGFIENERDPVKGEARFVEALRAARQAPDPATAVHLNLFGANPPRDDAALITLFAEPSLALLDTQLDAVPEAAALARTALRRFLSALPLSPERQFEVLVAAGEAVVNAIEHAYGERGGNVRLRGAVEGGSAVIEIEDEGGVWDVEAVDRVQRGYGLPLMHALSDSVEIARSAGGTRVRIAAQLTDLSAERKTSYHEIEDVVVAEPWEN